MKSSISLRLFGRYRVLIHHRSRWPDHRIGVHQIEGMAKFVHENLEVLIRLPRGTNPDESVNRTITDRLPG